MSILSSLFRQKQKPPQAVIEINNTFSSFSGTAYGNAAFRAAVDAISRHAAKLQAHSNDSGLETLLNTAPNAYMSGYDLLYKTAAASFTHNNAFLLLARDDSGRITAVYPITPQSVEFVPGTGGAVLHCERSAEAPRTHLPSEVVQIVGVHDRLHQRTLHTNCRRSSFKCRSTRLVTHVDNIRLGKWNNDLTGH